MRKKHLLLIFPAASALFLRWGQPTALARVGNLPKQLFASLAQLSHWGGDTASLKVDVPTRRPASVALTGLVFEDVNYGGGAGRPFGTLGTAPLANATVELYDAAGSYVSNTTTGTNGGYLFGVNPGQTYTVRVVNSSVTSTRPGYVAGLWPVQTYNGLADRVGGEAPEKADAPANSGTQTLASLTTPAATAQSVAAVAVGAGPAAGPEFGFNFDVVVNANDAGQGSLRQFILNANALGAEAQLAQAGAYANQIDLAVGTPAPPVALPTGRETSIFMIPGGQARPGLRAGLATQLVSGVGVVQPVAALPVISGPGTVINGLTQTYNVGNTNDVLLGTGGTVGTAATPLSRLNGPEVQITGTNAASVVGVDVAAAAAGFEIQGLAVYGFGLPGSYNSAQLVGNVRLAANNAAISQCVLGTPATNFAYPGPGPRVRYDNVVVSSGSAGVSVHHNLIGYVDARGMLVAQGATGVTVNNNEFRSNALSVNYLDGIDVQGSSVTITNNLAVDNGGVGFDSYRSAGGNVLVGNTVRGNGRGNTAQGPSETAGIRVYGAGNALNQNIVADNYGAGILVTAGASATRISQNSVFNNGTGTALDGSPASGQVGVDLLGAADAENSGTPPYVTFNDDGDGDAGANGLLNYPVLETATVGGGNLTLSGFATPGALLEVFVATPNVLTSGNTTANNFGQGNLPLFTRTEGSGQDQDNTTGSYGQSGALVNGFFQGTETGQNRFRFVVALSSLTAAQQTALAAAGVKLTATATVSNQTSEFSGNVAVGVLLSGVVFEDVNYGGGAGRSLAASAGTPRPGAAVELYDNAGGLLNTATTDAAGQYSFSVSAGTYAVRVVNSTVSSARLGYVAGLLPVQTYNGAVNRVGGEAPDKADAPANSGAQTLAGLTTATNKVQSLATVAVGPAGLSGVDFGFNFDVVVNTNDAGQGSLRQFILNANALGGETGLAQAGSYANQIDAAVGATPAAVALPVGKETSIFMIPNGQARAGLRAGLVNQLSAQGVALIRPQNYLGDITGPLTIINGLTQTYNVGNTNDVLLGTGGTVGVDGVALSRLNGPEVQVVGTASVAGGLRFYNVLRPEVHGLAVYGFGGGTNNQGSAGVFFGECNGPRFSQNVLGPSASGFGTDPGAGNRGESDHLGIRNSPDAVVTNNLLAFAEGQGLYLMPGSVNATVQNNEFVGNGQWTAFPLLNNIGVRAEGLNVTGNRLANAGGNALNNYDGAGSNCVVSNNTVEGNGQLLALTAGISLRQTSGWTLSRNIIRNNVGAGVRIPSTGNFFSNAIAISQNSIYGNGQVAGKETGDVGIDLQANTDGNDLGGNSPYVTLNDDGDGDVGGNGVLNFPVLESATLGAGTLTLTGFAAPGTLVEFFVAQPNALTSGNTIGNRFGQGKTFLLSRNEGSGQDLDATTGSYGQSSAPVNGVFQGTETNQNRFRFSMPLSSLTAAQQADLASSGRITATGTLGGATSEFSGNVVVGVPLAGVVFEDVNYGGGAGRGLAAAEAAAVASGFAAGSIRRPGAAVELYDNAGGLLNTATTDAAGRYEFSAPVGTYTVRVVNGTVSSMRPGSQSWMVPVQTFVNGDANRVGGEAPEKEDAPANAGTQTLASLTTAASTAQSQAPVALGPTGLADVNFGFNFNTIVNTRYDGQGSLLYFANQSSALGNANLAQQGRPAGQETTLFMIPNGQARPGLRAGLVNQLSAQGVAVIDCSGAAGGYYAGDANTVFDATTQTQNVGDTNPLVLGTGGTVGVGDSTLARVNGPEVQLFSSRSNSGIFVDANNVVVRGFSIYGFENSLYLANNRTGTLVERNVLGAAATSFTDPGAGRNLNSGIYSDGASNGVYRYNLIGFNGGTGLWLAGGSGSNNNVVRQNEIRNNSLENNVLDGMEFYGNSTGNLCQANLITGNQNTGIDSYLTVGGNVVRQNTLTANGQGGGIEGDGVRIWSGTNTRIEGNVIAGNSLTGVLVQGSAQNNVITGNAFARNISLGIDLVPSSTSPDGVTLNKPGGTGAGGNNLLNFPVLTTAQLSGNTLAVRGFVGSGAVVELYVAVPHPTGFGEGQTYLGTFVEGSAQDADATAGAYGPGAVNGLLQGQDNTNRFAFSLPLAGLSATQRAAVAAPGAKLTATATLGGATSEFSGNVAVGAPLAGVVFEDANYGGGAGRSRAASAGTPQPGVVVELYDNTGNFLNSTTTDATGRYEFSAPVGTYTVRVVNATVGSSRPGYVAGLLPVQTFANGDANRVGGEAPQKADAPANSGTQTLASLTTPAATAQSVAAVAVGANGASNVDFGFNFDVVVNTNDAGQGSLRQFILNANALVNTGLAQAGLPAGVETSVFMVPSGQAVPGLRSGLASGLTGGVAVITPLTDLPAVTGPNTTLSGLTQTANVGNTNPAVLGTGGTVGTNAAPLGQVNGPEVQVVGSANRSLGFELLGDGIRLAGLAVYGFGNGLDNSNFANVRVRGNDVVLTQNVIGTTAAAFADPGAGRTNADNVWVFSGARANITGNLIGFANGKGINTLNVPQLRVENNEISFNAVGSRALGGIGVRASNAVVQGNLVTGNGASGIDLYQNTGGAVIRGNTVSGNGRGGGQMSGVQVYGAGSSITTNLVRGNYGAGVLVVASASANVISQNSIFDNGTQAPPAGGPVSGQIGIDLLSAAANQLTGTAPYVTPNDLNDADTGANGLLNFPVLESASVTNGTLTLRGFARPGSLVELFLAAPDPSGFGQGQTYVASRTEGSADDADSGTGAYGPGAVNGLLQGQDNTNRFAFTIPLAGLPAAQQAAIGACGTKFTATATLGGNTSEFSGNVALSPAPLTVRVTGPVPACAGTTVRLSTGPRPGYLFTWFNGTAVVNGAGAVPDDSVFVASVSGSYSVRVVPANCAAGVAATSPSVVVTVLPAVLAGAVAADQTVCPGATPAPFTSTAPASGGTGTYAYQWEASPDNVTWADVLGATAVTYAPGPLTASTYFRRRVTSGTCAPERTAAVLVTVQPTVAAGTIGADQTVCPGVTPAPLTETAPPTGGTGTYAYQWEASTNNTTWTAVAGATGQGYAPGPVSSTTYFRRRTTSGTGTCATAFSNVATVSILPALTPGVVSADQTLCANAAPAPLSGSLPTGGTGTYAYQWEASTNNATWTAVAGATGQNYAPSPVTATTYFRRTVTSGTGTCAVATSNAVTLTILPAVTAGAVGSAQTICPGATPTPLTSTTLASGGTGTYAYQWETSPDNVTWTDVAGATASSYAPGPLTASTYFRRRVTSGTGTCAVARTAEVLVAVQPSLVAGTVGADQTVCPGAQPAQLVGTPATGGTGTYAYQWEASANNATWTAVVGATGASYAPGPVTATTYFRRVVTSGTGTCAVATSNAVTLTVLPALSPGVAAANQTVCAGTAPAPLTATAATGGSGAYAYQWESSPDNLTWGAIAGATGANYAPGPVTATTYFRRQVVSGSGACAAASTNVVLVTVQPALTAGTIGADQTLCANTTPAALTNTQSPAGGTGSYAYQWESSANNATWTAIAGATAAGYAPGPLAATTYFRRVVTSGVGSCAAAASNVVTVTVSPAPVASVSLTAPPTQCAGSTLTFTPNAANGGPSPTFRWFVNNVLTATAPTFSSATLANNDQVRVEMTPTPGSCATGVPTATVTVSLSPLVRPTVAIRDLNPGSPACAGTTLSYALDQANGAGAAPQYQWLVNNVAAAGSTGPTFASATLRDGDRVRLQLRSSEACASPAVVLSNEFVVTLRPDALPVVAIAGSGAACAGSAVRFSVTSSANLGAAPTYQWRVDGADVPGATAATFSTNTLRNGQLVNLLVRTVTVCGQPANAVSNAVAANVIPLVDVDAGPDKEIAEGESVELEGTANGTFPVEWSPTTDLSFANGNPLRPVASPKVTTVYTLRANVGGCQDESRVTVKVGPPIRIPSAFSPNGDGVNDSWEIDRIGDFAGNTVSIFNRWGNTIFTTANYSRTNQWNGTSQGKPAPVGTYYYIITLGNGKTYSGPVTVVY